MEKRIYKEIQNYETNAPSATFKINENKDKNRLFFFFFINDLTSLHKYLSVKVYNKRTRNQIKMDNETVRMELINCNSIAWEELD